jgi:hypothetical protein
VTPGIGFKHFDDDDAFDLIDDDDDEWGGYLRTQFTF